MNRKGSHRPSAIQIGIGLKATDAKAQHPDTWQGQNLLGFALMDVRVGLAGNLTSPTSAGLDRYKRLATDEPES